MKQLLVLILLLTITSPVLAQQPIGGTAKEFFKEPLFWTATTAIVGDHVTSSRIDGVKFREAGFLATSDHRYNQAVGIPLSIGTQLISWLIYRKNKKMGRISLVITTGLRGYAFGNNLVRMY